MSHSSEEDVQSIPQFDAQDIQKQIKPRRNLKAINITGLALFILIVIRVNSQMKLADSSGGPLVLRQAVRLYKVEDLNKKVELPFCVIVTNLQSFDSIKASVQSQNYTRAKVVKDFRSTDGQVSYQVRKQLILQNCEPNTLLLFVSAPLQSSSLIQDLNQIHINFNAWLTYTKSGAFYEVLSFYWRIYELLGKNDFDGTNDDFLYRDSAEVQALGLLELAALNTRYIQAVEKGISFLQVNPSKKFGRSSYTKLLRLSQDYQLTAQNIEERLYNRDKLLNNYTSDEFKTEWQILELSTLFKATQRQQLPYLPANHPTELVSLIEYNQQYQLEKYKQRQVRFCVTVLNHNNVQNNRLRKSLQTILSQEYQNYHIVFIDDQSDDESMALAMRFLQQRGFSEDRVTFVQNLKRNYATFNIINAAFNFCQQDEVQLLMDADDELIGRHAFQILNSQYQQDPRLWVVWTRIKDSMYKYFPVLTLQRTADFTTPEGKRRPGSFISPIRTWRVRLIHSIPLSAHKMSSGQWLDTLYDQALKFPLLQLAGINRVKSLVEVLYDYNINYGDNDNSSEEKLRHKKQEYEHILSRTPLKPISSLDDVQKNPEVLEELRRGNGTAYKSIE